MLIAMSELLAGAVRGGYAVGAFNVYNLEQARAVVDAAEAGESPAILQLHPKAYDLGGAGFLHLCLAYSRRAKVPICVHLDHAQTVDVVSSLISDGIPSVMADGARLPFQDNISFVREAVALARPKRVSVEAELGLLSGTEDGLTIEAREASLTDPDQAAQFVDLTGIDALAVCIGNVHGPYHGEPNLDFARLAKIRDQTSLPLVLHGASGLPAEMVEQAISLGVAKINVNTDLRVAYMNTLRSIFAGDEAGRTSHESSMDLFDVMQACIKAVKSVVAAKINAFGSAGKAPWPRGEGVD